MNWQPLNKIPNNPFEEARTWLVAASAGCGKTYVIKQTIKNLLTQGVQPIEIMFIQYNRRPTNEIRSTYFKEGLTKNDMLWWNTYDSIAQRLLRAKRMGINGVLTGNSLQEWGKKYGYPFTNEDDTEGTANPDRITNPVFESLCAKILAGKETELLPLEKKMLRDFENTALHEKRYPFILILRDALHQNLFPQEIKYIFVDEGQDNGVIQLEYYQRILNLHPQIKGFMMVGDDKQAINEYRGGSARTFLNFKADKHVTLPTTHRCTLNVLNTANKVIEPVKERSPIVMNSSRDIPGQVTYAGDFTEVLPGIQNMCSEGKTLLILQRTRYNLWRVRKLLLDFGIPIKSPLETNVLRILRAFKSIKDNQFITYQDHSDILPTIEGRTGLGQLRKTAYWKRGTFKEMTTEEKSLIAGLDMSMDPSYPCPLDKAEEVLNLGKDFIEDVERGFPRAEQFTGSRKEVYKVIQSYYKLGTNYHPVELSTIHAAKGREADVVVLIRNTTVRVEKAEMYKTDSERRVWYVACTRARDVLCITNLYLNRRDIYTKLI